MNRWLSDLFDSTKSHKMVDLMKKISRGISSDKPVPIENQIK